MRNYNLPTTAEIEGRIYTLTWETHPNLDGCIATVPGVAPAHITPEEEREWIGMIDYETEDCTTITCSLKGRDVIMRWRA